MKDKRGLVNISEQNTVIFQYPVLIWFNCVKRLLSNGIYVCVFFSSIHSMSSDLLTYVPDAVLYNFDGFERRKRIWFIIKWCRLPCEFIRSMSVRQDIFWTRVNHYYLFCSNMKLSRKTRLWIINSLSI